MLSSFFQASSPIKLVFLSLAFSYIASAQTWSACNPTTGQQCQPNPALGKSTSANLALGAPGDYTSLGSPTYDSNGASFSVAKPGDSPQLNSKWYIMFGRFEIVMKAAPGQGIVSSALLQSDALDEIDWEWLGGSPNEVQSNFFGKAQTGLAGRSAVHAVSGTQAGFHTYTIDWTASQIVWSIDGATVRVLQYSQAGGQYPQTPMQVKFGVWAGGDPSNPPGTIDWAGGATTYGAGPYTMLVKSVSVTDYSTGTAYKYSDASGTYQSIQAIGGSVNTGAGSGLVVASPAITSTSSGSVPWTGTHRSETTLATSINTNYPGLPSGWTVSSSGKVIPPSAAPSPSPSPLSSWSPPVSLSASPAAPSGGDTGASTVTGYNDQGFPTTMVVPAGPKHYDDRGFLITAAPAVSAPIPAATYQPAVQVKAYALEEKAASSATSAISPVTTSAPMSNGDLRAGMNGKGICIALGLFLGAVIVM